MIDKLEITDRVNEWGVRHSVVERDYALGWMLWGIASDPVLSQGWVFKGGTCLKKCYLPNHRFSQDLDFTVLPGGPSQVDELEPLLNDVIRRVESASGLMLGNRPLRLRVRPNGRSVEGRAYYTGPMRAPVVARIKLDITTGEHIVRPVALRPIDNQYSDGLPDDSPVGCYRLDELFAEKIRALGDRLAPRDLYDVVTLLDLDGFRDQGAAINALYVEKCRLKGSAPVGNLDSILKSSLMTDLKQEWGNMLGSQLPELPSCEHYTGRLPEFFEWLHGEP